MTVTFRLLELNGTEWLESRTYADGISEDTIQADAESWASAYGGELSWWIEELEHDEK